MRHLALSILSSVVLGGLPFQLGAGVIFTNVTGMNVPPSGVGISIGLGNFVAESFTTPATKNFVTSIDIALELPTGSQACPVTVSLMTDSGGLPGTILESYNLTNVPPFDGNVHPLSTVPSILFPQLSANTQYWVSATGCTGWIWNSMGNMGPEAVQAGMGGWTILFQSSPNGAFRVNGELVSEVGGNLGVFRESQWWLDGDGDFAWSGLPDRVFQYGLSTDIPIMGDWDNTGVRRIGVFRDGQWWLDINNDGVWDAQHDLVFSYGQAGDIPIIGDWTNTGVQRIGVFRQGQWWLDINNDHVWDSIHDIVFYYGQPGDVPLVGDWTNTGQQRIGVFRQSEWWLDINGDHVWDAFHDIEFNFGIPGDVPVIGDWTHTGQTRIGVFRQSQWWLDMNNDHVWDPIHDVAPFFGIASDIPVVAQ